MHSPIFLRNSALTFAHKTLFESFSAQIDFGSRIALIGRNGSGKSSLLKLLCGTLQPSVGTVQIPENVHVAYVPQNIDTEPNRSGGERFNKALTQALAMDPNMLLLDEPTNHLDIANRRGLLRLLQNFKGTLIAATHDVELLDTCFETLWHVQAGKIHIFQGNYTDYVRQQDIEQQAKERAHTVFEKQLQVARQNLQKEQMRAAKSRQKGEKKYQGGPKIVSNYKKTSAQKSQGKQHKHLLELKAQAVAGLENTRLIEGIQPKFYLQTGRIRSGTILSISEGACSLGAYKLENICASVGAQERIVIKGANGSGKSTFLKALLGDPSVKRIGLWDTAHKIEIGYLDQHYANLEPQKTVLEMLQQTVPAWTYLEIRKHLNSFLFRKNEEIEIVCAMLSGGEKVRLCLALLAARTPSLLLLDEITNNLDHETRDHVIQVLKAYPGALIIVSHDEAFLKELHIHTAYRIEKYNSNCAHFVIQKS